MLPGLGFQEIVFLAVIALVVVGPKDLPLMLRKLGRWTAKLRGMAQEFRTGFDELARQAELDELKREVEALRRTTDLQDIGRELSKPLPPIEDYVGASPAKPDDKNSAEAAPAADAQTPADAASEPAALMGAAQYVSPPQDAPSAEAEPDHAEPVARSAP